MNLPHNQTYNLARYIYKFGTKWEYDTNKGKNSKIDNLYVYYICSSLHIRWVATSGKFINFKYKLSFPW